MEELLLEFQDKMQFVSTEHKRYLFDFIDLKNRLIAVKGARGSGKTTLLLQLAKLKLPTHSTLYISLDHIYFYENTLYDLAKYFEKYGGTHLLLDEVHKYPNWSREIKLIYDNFPKLTVIFTSSSILELDKSESDLSRRMVSYKLKELSFREFLTLKTNNVFPIFTLDDILKNHTELAALMLKQIKPLPLFAEYLEKGVYPYYFENDKTYLQKLLNTINLIIEVDINAVENMNFDSLLRLKKLLKTIATSAPFTPNISKLSGLVGLSRNHLVHAIKVLERAGLITSLYKDKTGIGVLTKPEKLYLNNTNLMYALAKEMVNKGNMRETFILNQMNDLHEINLSEQVDFTIDKLYHLEVGGKNKKQTQLSELKHAYIVKDDIEIGISNIIPIWLFGFMY